MPTSRADIGWEYDSEGRPIEFKETETETSTAHYWHITTDANMAGPPCTIKVTKQRVKVESQRSRICSYAAVRHVVRAYGKATVTGVLFAGAVFLVFAGATVATGGTALVAGAGLLATAGSFTGKSAFDDLKYKRGARTCQAFSAWTIMSTTNIGNPVIHTQIVTCGRPITGGEQWIKVEEDEGTMAVAPDIAVVDSGTITVSPGED